MNGRFWNHLDLRTIRKDLTSRLDRRKIYEYPTKVPNHKNKIEKMEGKEGEGGIKKGKGRGERKQKDGTFPSVLVVTSSVPLLLINQSICVIGSE